MKTQSQKEVFVFSNRQTHCDNLYQKIELYLAMNELEDSQTHYDALTSFHTQALKLRRLLHCMSAIPTNYGTDADNSTANINADEDGANIPDRVFLEQIIVAEQTLDRIKQMGDEIGKMQSSSSAEEISEISEMLEYLESSVVASCEIVSEYLNARGGGVGLVHDDSAERLINHVFFDDLDENSDDETEDGMDDNDDDSLAEYEEDLAATDSVGAHQNDKSTTNGTTRTSLNMPRPKMTSEELQKEQKELLENEISQMADQLKQSSLHIKSTLAAQNVDLDEMETIAQANLDKTKDVTDKVTEQNRIGWRRSIGKWVTFFIILGTFVFCFLTIRLVPRRKDACLFFCNTATSKSSSAGADEEDDDVRKIYPKYSYCQEGDDGTRNQCTHPRDQTHHKRVMETLSNDVEDSDEFAYNLVEENRDRRYEMKLDLAQKEQDDLAYRRVRDGWDSSNESEEHLESSDKTDDENEEHVDDDGFDDDDDSNFQSNNDAYEDDDDDSYDDDEYIDNFDDDDEYINEKLNENENFADNTEGDMGKNDSESPADYDENSKIQYVRSDLVNAVVGGDVDLIYSIIDSNPELVRDRDANGWEPIHEAVRGGNVDTVEALVEKGGASFDAQIGTTGQGGNTLYLAKLMEFDESHPIIRYLGKSGVKYISPAHMRTDEL